MNGIRYRGMWSRLSVLGVLGVVTLLAACRQRGVTPEQTKEYQEAKKHQQESADDIGVPVEITNSIGMKLALIPAGEFLMGSPESEELRGDNEHQHRVRITKPFYLGVHEVTQAEYEKVMGENPSHFKGATNPVEGVSWDDATEFCKRLSAKEGKTYRLPTEAEWEYACRAGTTTLFHFGSRLNGREANCNGGRPHGTKTKGPSLGHTTTVGSYQPNAFGLYDMHGNVWEWCRDRHGEDYYRELPVDDPQGPSSGATIRVIRGGAWAFDSRDCRAANRNRDEPRSRSDDLGFRVAAGPPSKSSQEQASK